jgi:hypothetical protein
MLAPWGLRDEASATIADLLYALLRVTIAAYGKPGAANSLPTFEFPRPIPPRPKVTQPGSATLSGLGALDKFARSANSHG